MDFIKPTHKKKVLKKTVAVIGTAGIPAKYGGFETLVEYLVEHLSKDVNFIVYCSSVNYKVKSYDYKGAKLVYVPVQANGKWSVVYDSLCVAHSVFVSNTLLMLGVGGAFLLPFVKFLTRRKIITNIDGLEWKRDKWSQFAKAYLYVQESIAVKTSDVVIADNLGIEKYVRNKYHVESSLIAYGGSHAFRRNIKNETIRQYLIRFPYAFTVCRIEPENNVHLILKAFSQTDKNLVIIGNWDASEYGRDLKTTYQKFDNINLIDPIYDQILLNEIRSNCCLYVHGHSAGGTNPSLVEAMWLGLPIFAWNVNYNRYTTQNAAMFFRSVDNLLELLKNKSDVDVAAIGPRLQQIAEEEYNWEKIALAYFNLF